ncbi:MAG: hypothetical protein AABX38_06015 [Candidatus Micrarchaeota archaeon]
MQTLTDGVYLENAVEFECKKLELEIKYAISKSSSSEKAQFFESELLELNQKITKNSEKFSKQLKEIAPLPNYNRIKQLSEFLKANHDKLLLSLKQKAGTEYEFLTEFLNLLKKNSDNKKEIAKLNLIFAKLGSEDKNRISSILSLGSIESTVEFFAEEKTKLLLKKIFARLFDTSAEAFIIINGKKFWFDALLKDKFNDNLNQIKIFSTKMQVLSAQKQRGELDEEKDKEFSSLQENYLKLLKEQDELLKDFNEEYNFASTSEVKVAAVA